MTVLVDLKEQDLAARGCGNCSGSHSDNKIRAKVEDDNAPANVPADSLDSGT